MTHHLGTQRRKRVWRLAVGLLVLDSVLWALRLLSADLFLLVVRAERLLFLQGPPLALVHKTPITLGIYVVGMTFCVPVLWLVVHAETWPQRVLLVFAFVLLWSVWGAIASAPAI